MLQPQLLVLTPQPGQLATLGRSQPIALFLPATLFPIRLRNPVTDRLRRRLALAGKARRIAASANQLYDLAMELRGIDRATVSSASMKPSMNA